MPNGNVIEWPDYEQEQRRQAALTAMDAVRSGQAKEVGMSDWLDAKKSTAEQNKLKDGSNYGQQSLRGAMPGLPKARFGSR